MGLLLILSLVTASKIIEYRFGSNFGPIIADYSGNSHLGVNGDSYSTTTYDAVFTDQGAFFTGYSAIKLPNNEIFSEYIKLTSLFSVTMWVMSKEGSGVLMYKFNDGSNYFYLERSSVNNNLITHLAADGEKEGNLALSSDNFPISKFLFRHMDSHHFYL